MKWHNDKVTNIDMHDIIIHNTEINILDLLVESVNKPEITFFFSEITGKNSKNFTNSFLESEASFFSVPSLIISNKFYFVKKKIFYWKLELYIF